MGTSADSEIGETMSHSSRSRVLSVCVVALLFVSILPPVAFASVNDIPFPLGVSPTNPDALDSPETNWRGGWGNSTTVEYILNLPQVNWAEEGHIRHVHYRFDRDPDAFVEVVPNGPRVDVSTVFLSETTAQVRKDLVSHWFQESETAWNYTPLPGQKRPFEGTWYISWRFEADGPAGGQSVLAAQTIGPYPLGIDVTPPMPVRKLTAKPSERYAGPIDLWTDSQQAYVFWEDAQYDELSGVAYFEVQVDRETHGSGVFYLPPTRPYVTIPDMPPGKSEIRVRAVDRATNAGPWTTTHFYSDPDEPGVEVVFPAKNGDLIGATRPLKAQATDLAGIRWVRFEINGRHVGTVFAPRLILEADFDNDVLPTYEAQLRPDWGPFANGSHTLKVTAADMFGREVSALRTFQLDKTAPRISNVRSGPSLFYPIIREGYRDWMTAHFDVSKNVRTWLYIYDESGKLYATRTAPSNAGATSISWDGAGDESGSARVGTFTFRLKVVDAAGNETWWGAGTTTIRDFEIVRIAPNAVRIIPR